MKKISAKYIISLDLFFCRKIIGKHKTKNPIYVNPPLTPRSPKYKMPPTELADIQVSPDSARNDESILKIVKNKTAARKICANRNIPLNKFSILPFVA